jgi:ribosomal protein L37E
MAGDSCHGARDSRIFLDLNRLHHSRLLISGFGSRGRPITHARTRLSGLHGDCHRCGYQVGLDGRSYAWDAKAGLRVNW